MSIAANAFGFLREQVHRTFHADTFLWLPEARGGTDYTVAVPCVAGMQRGASQALVGLLTIPTDGVVFDVEAALLPFEPRPEDHLMYGVGVRNPDTGDWEQDADRPAVKFKITGASKAEYHSHWRLTAERVS